MSQFGVTPLHYAAIEGNFDIFKLIYENVEDKNPKVKDGENIL